MKAVSWAAGSDSESMCLGAGEIVARAMRRARMASSAARRPAHLVRHQVHGRLALLSTGHTGHGFQACNGTSPVNAEYVPMVWGKWALANASHVISELESNPVTRDARFIFGFNEPDHSGSYLKPQDAAARWPGMELIARARNLTLVAPCVSNYNSGQWWLQTFVAAYKNMTAGGSPRMDHMFVHAYYDPAPLPGMMEMVERIARDYKRPVPVAGRRRAAAARQAGRHGACLLRRGGTKGRRR